MQVLLSFVHYMYLSSAEIDSAIKCNETKTSLRKLDCYGPKFDEKLRELRELQTKVISNPEEFKLEHTDETFKLVLDNIDFRITTHDMTSDRQNKDIHWVNHSAVKNCVTLGSRKRKQSHHS